MSPGSEEAIRAPRSAEPKQATAEVPVASQAAVMAHTPGAVHNDEEEKGGTMPGSRPDLVLVSLNEGAGALQDTLSRGCCSSGVDYR